MPTGAIYNTKNGLIVQTISPPLSNQAQLDGLAAQNLAQTIIPDGKNGGTGMIDLAAGQYADFQPQPMIPDLLTQLAAALVNKGVISSSDLHPATVVEINAQLADTPMIAIGASRGASTAG